MHILALALQRQRQEVHEMGLDWAIENTLSQKQMILQAEAGVRVGSSQCAEFSYVKWYKEKLKTNSTKEKNKQNPVIDVL